MYHFYYCTAFSRNLLQLVVLEGPSVCITHTLHAACPGEQALICICRCFSLVSLSTPIGCMSGTACWPPPHLFQIHCCSFPSPWLIMKMIASDCTTCLVSAPAAVGRSHSPRLLLISPERQRNPKESV